MTEVSRSLLTGGHITILKCQMRQVRHFKDKSEKWLCLKSTSIVLGKFAKGKTTVTGKVTKANAYDAF